MFAEILRLSRHTLVYGVGTVLVRVVAFLLLPLFTRLLEPSEYGIYTLYFIAVAVVLDIVRMGQDISLLRYYVMEKDPRRRKRIFSTLFFLALGVSVIVAAVMWLEASHVVRLIVSLPDYPPWTIYTLKLCAGIILLDNLSGYPLVLMRAEGKASRFIAVKLAGSIAYAALVVLFLAYYDRGVAGIFEANLIASALMMALCLPQTLRSLKPVFDSAILKMCLAFGLPNVPNLFFVIMTEQADRKVIEVIRGAAEAGLYSAGYRLGMFMMIVAMGFRLAWQPFFLRIADRPDAKLIYARVLTYFLAVLAWLYLLLTAFVDPLVRWDIPGLGPFIDPSYWEGLKIFPVILLAHIFNGVFAVFMVGIYLKKKTGALPLISGVAAVVNIGGNILFVPAYGMVAAAWLTVVSYAAMAGMIYLYVQRHYRISYEWGRVMHVAIVAVLVYLIHFVSKNWNLHWVGFILAVVFPAILLVSGLATQGEKGRLKSLLITGTNRAN